MQSLLKNLDQCIALSGAKGFPISELSKAIPENIQNSNSISLVKQRFWNHLLDRSKLEQNDTFHIRFLWTPITHTVLIPSDMNSQNLGLRIANTFPATSQDLSQDLSWLEQDHDGYLLRAVASYSERCISLGLFNPDTILVVGSFILLEAIGQAGSQGVSQSDVSKLISMDPKTVFHHLKRLRQLQLVVTRNTYTKKGNAPGVHTQQIFLKKFGVRDSMEDSDNGHLSNETDKTNNKQNTAETQEPDESVGGSPNAIVYSELAMKVCQVLSTAPYKTLAEMDIKSVVASYSQTRKRATWPTIRKILLERGLIDCFIAALPTPTNRSTQVNCVRLLKFPTSIFELEVAIAKVTKRVSIPLYIELPIDFQMFLLISEHKQGFMQAYLRPPGISVRLVSRIIDTLKTSKLITATQYMLGKTRSYLLRTTQDMTFSVPIEPVPAYTRLNQNTHPISENLDSIPMKMDVGVQNTAEKQLTILKSPLKPKQIENDTQILDPSSRRRIFVYQALKEKGIIPTSQLRFMIREYEAELLSANPDNAGLGSNLEGPRAEIASKTVKNIVQQLVSSGDASVVKTNIGIGGRMRLVELLIDSTLNEYEWKVKLQQMAESDLARPVGKFIPSVPSNLTDLDGIGRYLNTGEISETKAFDRRQDLSIPTKSVKKRKRSISDQPYESDSESEYDFDENEDLERNENTNMDSDEREYQDKLHSINNTQKHYDEAFSFATSLGLYRAKLARARTLHTWLCCHVYFPDFDITKLIPNDLESNSTLQQTLPAAFESALLTPQAQMMSASTFLNAIVDHNQSRSLNLASQDTISDEISGIEQLHEGDFKKGKISKRSKNKIPQEIPVTAPSTPILLDEHQARSMWFNGPVVNIENILQNMPFYIYLKTIGLFKPIPGVDDPRILSGELIKDISPTVKSVVLSRKTYRNRLNAILNMLKEFNLLHPKILFGENENIEQLTEPNYIMNHIGIIWPPTADKPLILNINSPHGLIQYWKVLDRESTQYTRLVEIGTKDIPSNHPPKLKVYPEYPGLPASCTSVVNWTGYTARRTTPLLQRSWTTVSAEMKEMPGEVTPTMKEISISLNMSPESVLSWYQTYDLKLTEKRNVKATSDSSSAVTKFKPTSSRSNKSTTNLQLNGPIIEDPQFEGLENDVSLNRQPRNRMTKKQISNCIKIFIQLKAKSKHFLEDPSDLWEGVNKETFSQLTNKPIETLEKIILQTTLHKNSWYELIQRVSEAIYASFDVGENEEMAVDFPTHQIKTFHVPTSIEVFRSMYSFDYKTNASNIISTSDPSFVTETYQSSLSQIPDIGASQTNRRSHVQTESNFYSFTDIFDSSASVRSSSSEWMIIEDTSSNIFLEDTIKAILLAEKSSITSEFVKHVIMNRFNTSEIENCFHSMRNRHILSGFTANSKGKPHLSPSFLHLFQKNVEQYISTSAESVSFQQMIDTQNDPDYKTAFLDPWSVVHDPYCTGGAVAVILRGLQTQTLTINPHINSENVGLLKRRKRSQILSNDGTKMDHDPEKDPTELVTVTIRKWYERNLYYVSDMLPNSDINLDSESNDTDNELLAAESPYLSSTTSYIVNDLIEDRIEDINYYSLQFCDYSLSKKDVLEILNSIYQIIQECGPKGIELLTLESSLLQLPLFQKYSQYISDDTIHYGFSLILNIILDILNVSRKIYAFPGIFFPSYVAVEHGQQWLISTQNDEEIVYLPWHLPNGQINTNLLRHLKIMVSVAILQNPGISEEQILSRFCNIFRPGVLRIILDFIESEKLVTVQYFTYNPVTIFTFLTTESNTEISSESEYFYYIRNRFKQITQYFDSKVTSSTYLPDPKKIVTKNYWPTTDLQTEIK